MIVTYEDEYLKQLYENGKCNDKNIVINPTLSKAIKKQ